MTFYYLLLGHLTGDFVLQTNKIAENKGRQWEWNLLHVLVVTLCIFVFSFPFGILLNLLVLLNGAVHYVLDYYKDELRKSFHLSELECFLFDQILHILFLFIISQSAIISNRTIIDVKTVKFLIVLVLVTSFSAVFTQFILAAMFPRSGGRFFEEGEKAVGILTRLFISAVFYVSFTQSTYFLLLLLIAASSFFLKFKLEWKIWMSPSHLFAKLLLDTFISAACILLVIL